MRSKTIVGGFTLIEVMAALVIVSLGMMAVIQAVSQTASDNAYMREKTIAQWVAMNRITEIRLAAQPPDAGETSGEVEMAGKRWRWSAQVTAVPTTTMRRIEVGVAPIVDAKMDLDNKNQMATITGFFGEKIAPPGNVIAQFDAAPAATSPPPTTPATPPAAPPAAAPAR